MNISAAQSRAARALLDWTQDDLAKNAQVARATIADFERNLRNPMRNNIISIKCALEAAGIEFVEEDGDKDKGVGVRFRKVQIEYNKNLKFNFDGVSLFVRYKGKNYTVLIPKEIIDDKDRATYSDEQAAKAVEKNLPIYLVAIEKTMIDHDLDNNKVILNYSHFQDGTF